MIVALTREHAAAAAAIHCQVLTQDLLARLGPEFLQRYLYERVAASAHALGYVYLHEGQVVGYVTGVLDQAAFYHYSWRELVSLPVQFLPGLLRQPRLLPALGEALAFMRVKRRLPLPDAEIASVAVLPEYRTPDFYRVHGQNVALALNLHLIRALRARGAREAFGIFRADNGLALVAYQNLGFVQRVAFDFRGSRRLLMVCDVNAARLVKRLENS